MYGRALDGAGAEAERRARSMVFCRACGAPTRLAYRMERPRYAGLTGEPIPGASWYVSCETFRARFTRFFSPTTRAIHTERRLGPVAQRVLEAATAPRA